MPSTIATGVVAFDASAFQAAYPQFASIPVAILDNNFAMASLVLTNKLCSVVVDVNARALLLNLLVAHITAQLNGEGGNPAQGAVGRITSATEGSVTAQLDLGLMPTSSELGAWLAQTQYGLMFLAMTTKYRTFRYRAPRPRCYGPSFFGPGDW